MKPASPLSCLVAVFLTATPLFSQQLPPGAMGLRDPFAESAPIPFYPYAPPPHPGADLIGASCLADDLDLDETVLCHPASRYLELRLDLTGGQGAGPVMFEVYDDTTWISNLSLESGSGNLFIRNEYMGRTITLSQVGETGCSRDFVVPACTESVCPLEEAGEAVPMDCDGDMVHYRFALRHDPPIEIPTTDFAVYDEKGEFLMIFSLAQADSLVDLFVPASLADREYRLCDLFNPEGCCVTVVLPGIDCNSVPTGVSGPADPGVFRLFPNPVVDILQVDLADGMALDGSYSYRIVQATGGLVASGVLDGMPTAIPVTTLSSGTYLVGLWRGETLLGYRRVVKVW